MSHQHLKKNPWERITEAFKVLQPCWLATLLVLITSGALHHPQSVDALSSLALDQGFFHGGHLGLVLPTLLLALSAWYFPRALLYVKYRITPADTEERFEWLRCWFPRTLGVLPIASLTVAYFRGGHALFGLFYLLLGVSFVVTVYFRRIWLSRKRDNRRILLYTRMQKTTTIAVTAVLMLSFILFLMFLYSPVTVPQHIGPIGIVMIAAAAWVGFGSVVLIYPTYHYRLPSLVFVLLLFGTLFSFWNDNHGVRETMIESTYAQRPTVEQHFEQWLKHREPVLQPRKTPYPIFVVAAEGGGIRAGYWTASVLSHLQETYPEFACHVYAISGVSGGSLGAAVFAAQTADYVNSNSLHCDSPATVPSSSRSAAGYRAVLGEDFLSPVLAGMLFPDLVQHSLPFWGGLALPDRAEHLERSWEQAWKNKTGSVRFSEDFLNLWSGEGLYAVPSLFLNGTWVEDGSRNVTSNLVPRSPNFLRLDDLLSGFDRTIRLSTAVHMSSRFPYVSPPGTVRYGKEERRVVDGAYFENSGALTATELLATLKDSCIENPECDVDAFEWIAIIISNNPDSPHRAWETEPCTSPPSDDAHSEEGKSMRTMFLSESLSPIVAMFATRSARGFLAEDALRELATPCRTIRFQLQENDEIKIPLGWMISEKIQANIYEQIQQATTAGPIGLLLKGEAP